MDPDPRRIICPECDTSVKVNELKRHWSGSHLNIALLPPVELSDQIRVLPLRPPLRLRRRIENSPVGEEAEPPAPPDKTIQNAGGQPSPAVLTHQDCRRVVVHITSILPWKHENVFGQSRQPINTTHMQVRLSTCSRGP